MRPRLRLRSLSPARSLAARIVFFVVALLLVVQTAGFTSIRRAIDGNARQRLAADLSFAESVVRKVLAQQAERLAAETGVFADDYGFKSTLGADRATIESVLQYRAYNRLRASLSAVVDAEGRVEAAWNVEEGHLARMLASFAAPGREAGAGIVTLVDGIPTLVVRSRVVIPGAPERTLVMGFPLAQRLARSMRDFSLLDATVVVVAPGGRWRTLATTLDAQPAADDVTRAMHALAAASGAGTSIALDGQEHLARLVPLAEGESVHAMLTGSLDAAVAPYRTLQWGLGMLTLASLAAFAIGSVFTARHVTTPLRSLVAAAERVGRGDYDTPIDRVATADEVGELASAFERMRHNVAAHQAEIRRLAFWDPLTGLPNRAQFTEVLRRRLGPGPAQGDGDDAIVARGGVAVVMFDLDRFKHVNDVLGYAIGDRLLVQVALRLRELFPAADGASGPLVARFGGDEFAVLLPDADAAGALVAATLIEAGFARPLVIEDQTLDLAAGIGIACAPEHALDAEDLLARAEAAMYAAKHKTTGPMVYDASLDAASAQTLSLLSELRQAVAQGELRLFLQPRMALATGELVGAEALVRWQHPERGLVPPMAFIPFAEQTGFIRTLTLWVFEEACRRRAELHSAGIDIRVSLNLSARDLVDPRLPEVFADLLARYGAAASSFCLEITESTIMDDPERALQTVERLHAMGFKLAIDDFGTGYSSLAYLKRLPVDELKIDKSFVFGMERDPEDAKIVRSTIDLAHNLGLAVVAEGVENDAVVAMLRDLSCDEGQGYHFAKPMPLEAFVAWAGGRPGMRDPANRSAVSTS